MKIDEVIKNNLCVSCGICQSICPNKCITTEYENGNYIPKIDESECINCGLCHKLCPGKGIDYVKMHESTPEDLMLGNFKECLIVQSNDKDLLSKTQSGGFITTLIKNLLSDEVYDSAFLVDTYDYSKEVKTQRYTKADDLTNTTKSRYIPVNHSNAIKYILENRDEKIILVGTPCFIQGFLQVVEHFKLNRENYLLLGLFCDKNMNYNIRSYFKAIFNDELENLYFRTKDNGKWPGNIILENNNKKWLLPSKIRKLMKEYFCLERCLYCLDKLNQFADISCGDNYTKGQYKSSKEGTSNIIIRTELGKKIFNAYEDKFVVNQINVNEIIDSQNISLRKDNYIYSFYKSTELGYSFNNLPTEIACSINEEPNHRKKYKDLIQKQNIGKNKDFPMIAADMCLRAIIPYKFILNVTNDLLDKKIIIYGAGAVGRDYYIQLYKYSRVEIVGWVDSNYSKYNYKEGKVQSVDVINDLDYDLILIAVRDKSIVEKIKNFLQQRGINQSKIFWSEPVCN